ncbi:MAG TPA: diacylglycerol kinase family protein [Caldimonas sp.]|nr:diacylglycerol kinase family protein [Caldimonas sp.]HEX4234275.1 diacylglycerol kinase family protein [Caldimonas sp.]
MTRSIVVLLNATSGSGTDAALAAHIGGLFERAGASADVRLLGSGRDLAVSLQEAIDRRPDVIVAGGGDGTISSVAAALAGGPIALGVLALGTLNHFAKDMKLALEIDAAVERIARGEIRRVDVGEVNGRVFVNNSSLGLYPDIVHDRERQRRRLGRGKWPALVWATIGALRRFPFLQVRLSVDGRDGARRTPFVFIGNNVYRMEGFAIGERERLDSGCLSLYVAQRPGRLRLVQLALRALFGKLRQARDFDAIRATEIDVESRRHRLRVATDGEITVMQPPLRYRIRRANLAVVGAPQEPPLP